MPRTRGLRDGQARQRAHRPFRDPVHGQQGGPGRAHRRSRARGQDRRRVGPARRIGSARHPRRDRAEEGRARRGDPEPALQADAHADHVRGEHARPRRWAPAAAPDHRRDPALPRLPPRGGRAPRGLRPGAGRSARPHPRRLRDRARSPGRGDLDHSRLRGYGERADRTDVALRSLPAAGPGDPGHAAPQSDGDGAPARPRRARGAAGAHRRAAGPARQRHEDPRGHPRGAR